MQLWFLDGSSLRFSYLQENTRQPIRNTGFIWKGYSEIGRCWIIQLSGESTGISAGRSDMRKRVRKCSEINMTASLFRFGSCCTRYFIASTRRRWPSIKRGSDFCGLALRRFGSGIVGLTGMVKTLATLKPQAPIHMRCQSLPLWRTK